MSFVLDQTELHVVAFENQLLKLSFLPLNASFTIFSNKIRCKFVSFCHLGKRVKNHPRNGTEIIQLDRDL